LHHQVTPMIVTEISWLVSSADQGDPH
jgi:hypothetical protein